MKVLEPNGKYIGVVDESYKLHIVDGEIHLYAYVCREVPEFPALILNIDKLKDVVCLYEGKHWKAKRDEDE